LALWGKYTVQFDNEVRPMYHSINYVGYTNRHVYKKDTTALKRVTDFKVM